MERGPWDRRLLLLCAAALSALLIARTTPAATIHVPGDQPTIQTGLAAALPGDTVLVACGSYFEHGLVLGEGVCLRSGTGDPACVTIDAGGQGRVMECAGLDAPVRVEGITVTGGADGVEGGGILCEYATIALSACVFRDNQSGVYGGAVTVVDGSVTLDDCLFESNHCTEDGGGFNCTRSPLEMNRCVFRGNTANYGGAAVIVGGGLLRIEDCFFEGNSATERGGAVAVMACAPLFSRCTFDGNSAAHGGAFYCLLGGNAHIGSCTLINNAGSLSGGGINSMTAAPFLNNSIIAFSPSGEAVSCGGNLIPTLHCCDLFGNADGDWVGCIADQAKINGNLSADPLFCFAENPEEPYTLSSASPCAEENNPGCGQIGAWPVGCHLTATQEASWSEIKALY